jgi:hypothetical protein
MTTEKRIKDIELAQIRARDVLVSRMGNRLTAIYSVAMERLFRQTKQQGSIPDRIRTIADFNRILNDIGLAEEVAAINRHFSDELRFARDLLIEGSGVNSIAGLGTESLVALSELQLDNVLVHLNSKEAEIKEAIFRSITLGESDQTFAELVKRFTSDINRTVITELNTSFAVFSRSATAEFAKESGLKLFLYSGPEDSITREFCKRILRRSPPIYTLAQIQAESNGQGIDVLTGGGGYNCRHSWAPVSEEFARNLGWKP